MNEQLLRAIIENYIVNVLYEKYKNERISKFLIGVRNNIYYDCNENILKNNLFNENEKIFNIVTSLINNVNVDNSINKNEIGNIIIKLLKYDEDINKYCYDKTYTKCKSYNKLKLFFTFVGIISIEIYSNFRYSNEDLEKFINISIKELNNYIENGSFHKNLINYEIYEYYNKNMFNYILTGFILFGFFVSIF